jgi:type I restriction enzyme S subunit
MYPVKPIYGKTTREFLWALFLSKDFSNYTEILPSRANIPKLNRQELAAYEFGLPAFEKQEKFSEFIFSLEKLKQENSEKLEKLDTLFNALVQKAFKGELIPTTMEHAA